MAINTIVQQLCREETIGFVGMFFWRADTFMRDGLHLSGKGATVFADELSAVVNNGMVSIKNIFGSKHCASNRCRSASNRTRYATSTHKPVTKCQENISEAGYKCVCLNVRSIVNNKN